MFRNCNRCCMGNPSINAGTYVEILNKTNLSIYFIIQYNVDVRTFTRRSPAFGLNQKERMNFPPTAMNIAFNVLNDSIDPPGFICNVVLPFAEKSCYELTQSQGGLQFIKVKC